MSIRTKLLIAFLTLTALPGFFIGRVAFTTAGDAMLRESRKNLANKASLKADKLGMLLRETDSSLWETGVLHETTGLIRELEQSSSDTASRAYLKAENRMDELLIKRTAVKSNLSDNLRETLLAAPGGRLIYASGASRFRVGETVGPLASPLFR